MCVCFFLIHLCISYTFFLIFLFSFFRVGGRRLHNKCRNKSVSKPASKYKHHHISLFTVVVYYFFHAHYFWNFLQSHSFFWVISATASCKLHIANVFVDYKPKPCFNSKNVKPSVGIFTIKFGI